MKTKKHTLLSVLVFLSAITLFAPVSGGQAENYHGFYRFGHEVRTFQPCGSEQVYWVRAEGKIDKELREAHQKLTAKPYAPIYAEVRGRLMDRAAEGFAANYDGQIVIESIVLLRIKQKEDCGPAKLSIADITGMEWKWQQTRYNNDQQARPQDPSRYTVLFRPDGTLNIRADCNRAGGKYAIQTSALTVEVTHSTRAACPPDSLEQTFLQNLNSAAIYFMKEGQLYIDLKYDTGTMKFVK
ncbi:MAG: META domain-containing protein [Deltaproteobacteria bacterium]|nr:META domain-containing protein [Deltaproteobacteria bacterium]